MGLTKKGLFISNREFLLTYTGCIPVFLSVGEGCVFLRENVCISVCKSVCMRYIRVYMCVHVNKSVLYLPYVGE